MCMFLTGHLISLVSIRKQPKDQIVQFKKDQKEIVKLTCYAESFEGNDLCYEWYCGNFIVSCNCYAEIKLKRPSRNMEKQYYCKVSIANQPEHYVISRTAVIKLEISKFAAIQ